MTLGTGVVSGVRVSHDCASIEDIEAACPSDHENTLADLLAIDGVEEAFTLQTCNRIEAYVVTDSPTTGQSILSNFSPSIDSHSVRWGQKSPGRVDGDRTGGQPDDALVGCATPQARSKPRISS